ncbi:MAG: hypothetical protein ACREN4_03570 [Candidatus Dormibacteria bacterium]
MNSFWNWADLWYALVLGALATGVVLAWPRRPTAERWLRERSARRSATEAAPRPWLRQAWVLSLERWLPEGIRRRWGRRLRIAGLAPEGVGYLVLAACLLVWLALASAAAVGLLPAELAAAVAVVMPLGVLFELRSRAFRRRAAIRDQLPILVDLMALEQSGGGIGPRAAMEAVVGRLGGEAALVLRGCLIASAAAGTLQLDRQLERAAEELDIDALGSLAVVVRMQREEGVATSAPLGELARGLRDRQRDDLVARGRRALITMLLPVALCILLPFVVIILYPALERLSTAF